MKKKYTASSKDKKDWINFTRQINNIRPKEADLFQENIQIHKVPKLDLHGFSLEESNKKVKKFIIEFCGGLSGPRNRILHITLTASQKARKFGYLHH